MESAKAHHDVRTLLGVFDEATLVAIIFTSIAEESDHPNAIEINDLFVKESHRGQKLSLKLIDAVLNQYATLGFEAIVVYSHKYAPSDAFYHKLGETVIKTLKQLDDQLIVEVFLFDLNELKQNLQARLK